MQFISETLFPAVASNWPVWLVTATLILAAVIDGLQLKVPNWITFPLVISGWILSGALFGLPGIGWSLAGTAIGLGMLLPLYAIGGMGAGDVKLLGGVGAWMYIMLDAAGSTATTAAAMGWSFTLSVVIGMVLAVIMVLARRAWGKHYGQFWLILNEIRTVKSPTELSKIASQRKSSMLLLPYGIPIAMGTISYFAWSGMLI